MHASKIVMVAGVLFGGSLPAQGQQAPHPKQALLDKAFATMVALPSVAFETSEERDLEMAREQGIAMWTGLGGMDNPSADEVKGIWTRDLVHATKEDHELLQSSGRTIARESGKTDWKLRYLRLSDGQFAPRIVDPQALVLAMACADLKIVHAAVDTRDDRPVEVITATLEGDDVAELMWAGLLPVNGTGSMFFAGPGVAQKKPEAKLDLCIVLDPATGIIHEIKTTSYGKSGLEAMGGVFVAAAPVAVGLDDVTEADAEEEKGEKGEKANEQEKATEKAVEKAVEKRRAEEAEAAEQGKVVRAKRATTVALRALGGPVRGRDDEADEEPEGPLKFEQGLPVRSKKKMDVMHFSIRFSQHGTAKVPELDARARRLLGR